jgi:hypothetical protein
MKIRDIQTTLLSVPLNPPIADSTHVLNQIQWIAVDALRIGGLSQSMKVAHLSLEFKAEAMREFQVR